MGNQPQHSEDGNLSAAAAVAVDDRDQVEEKTASTNSDPLDLPQAAEEETDVMDELASGITQAIVAMALRRLQAALGLIATGGSATPLLDAESPIRGTRRDTLRT